MTIIIEKYYDFVNRRFSGLKSVAKDKKKAEGVCPPPLCVPPRAQLTRGEKSASPLKERLS